MFKKLKDKLAEEVKSSPQRIQQFAQAAQAAVTSASSSISDITNTDLFTIGDNDSQQGHSVKAGESPVSQTNTFQDVSLIQPASLQTSIETVNMENQRQRRLSNSSFASDVSFRLPSYDSPSMYHLQSDVEISASEAEERGFSGGTVSLDRVTKEQIYAAYRRTQERYTKYRTQYADLARHYKLLERENAKARSVLVETQDKALRRISELREQCSLEQSAKAHLEKALRIEMDEKNIKIDTLNTKIQLLQSNIQSNDNCNAEVIGKNDDAQLINLSIDNEEKSSNEELASSEIIVLNNKIEKFEQLLSKYKESLKTSKEKNGQLTTELQMLSSELQNKSVENEQLKVTADHLIKAREQIQELNDLNEELQNKVNSYDFTKTKEFSTLEIDLQKAQEKIQQLHRKIEVFTKREEEYAISLAENKLSIHKELETKENEIKSLKDSLSASKKEIQSLNIVVSDYKNTRTLLEEEQSKRTNDVIELNVQKNKITELESQIQVLSQKCQTLDNAKAKADEEFKCLQLQLKQETAEKLAMIDRNKYLENRNTQLSDENTKKSSQISNLDSELLMLRRDRKKSDVSEEAEKNKKLDEIDFWKSKFGNLESEIQEEREELVKLQSEIEKLLANHELIQLKNSELQNMLSDLQSDNALLKDRVAANNKVKVDCESILHKIKDLQKIIYLTSQETKSLTDMNNDIMPVIKEKMAILIANASQVNEMEIVKATCEELRNDYVISQTELKEVSEQCLKVSNELNVLQKENEELKSEIKIKDSEKVDIVDQVQSISTKYEMAVEELQLTENEKQKLLELIEKTENKYQHLQITMENETDLKSTIVQKAETLEQENNDIINKLKIIEENNLFLTTEIDALRKRSSELKKDNDDLMSTLQSTKNENEKLVEKVDLYEGKCQHLEEKMESETNQKADIDRKAQTVEQEKNTIAKKLQIIKDEKLLLTTKINALIKDNEELVTKYSELKRESDELIIKISQHEGDKQYISRLEENIKTMTQENISLKGQSEQITNSLKNLEFELTEVRKSHADMEIEKDRLNSVLEKLANNENVLNDRDDKDTQTDESSPTQRLDKFTNTTHKENGGQTEEAINLINENDSECRQEIKVFDTRINFSEKNLTLNHEYTAQKEENKRLQSDITGLQTYLAKISKENSALNDKLREFIASSENSSNKNDNMDELLNLKNEIQIGKEKIDELLRENTLLIDENLELKDQATSHNYDPITIKPINNGNKDTEFINLNEKYNNLLDTKNKLEKRMNDLEHMNNSVNGNMMHMQEHNDKLRLSNEKLERRLDEALVSLRHLHSLQENTELEYLRNILYEYLTGSGTHSVTLAKVLAAVVKFDDTQTQQILQKEKERQGLLRQLGLL